LTGKAQTVMPAQGVIRIPLTVLHNARFDVYKANVSVGIGNLNPMPMGFDTGSAGLHVFAAAKLDRPGSGVTCSNTPVTFTVGNPGRVTYTGVMCSAPLHFQGFTTPEPVPIAYLSSAACARTNPGCKIPDVASARAHGGTYGVFGAGITGAMPVTNPILTLPPPYGSIFSIALSHERGELTLGAQEPAGAVPFSLSPGTRSGVKWQFAQTCLYVNGNPTNTCLAVSFDTGNGVPWIRDANASAIPQSNGLVIPSTRIGFGPLGASREATDVVAGTSFANRIKVESTTGAPLTNTGIAAFFGHVVTYDNVHGTISVAPQ